jgi:plastocyanin
MKKVAVIIVALLVVGGAAAAFFILNDKDDTSTSNTSTQADNSGENESTQQESATEESETAVATDEVEIENFAFGPDAITVKKGTKVTWTNKDSTKHTVTPDEEGGAFEGSELLAQDESYSFTFDQAGTYTYHCQPHPEMTGTVVVTE